MRYLGEESMPQQSETIVVATESPLSRLIREGPPGWLKWATTLWSIYNLYLATMKHHGRR